MLDIEVRKPTKTDQLYEFTCDLQPHRSLGDRLRRRGPDGPAAEPSELEFGFRARNFSIRHHDVWDGFYPLLFLTRNGGPLFNRGFDEARIRFRYAIPRVVRDFFIRRAADFGISVSVDADTNDARIDAPTEGDVLAFGGGKDSRLLLGMLRELGSEPTVITAKGANATDIPDARVTESLHGALADRIMPSYMALGERFFFGAGLGEIQLERPWQQYYDVASPRALAQTSQLLTLLGVETRILSPTSVLPYSITQRILHDRYPELYRYQASTRPGARNEKSLHVALLKLGNGFSFEDQCNDSVFVEMLSRFVRRQTQAPNDFGYRNFRETINREMRAIIWRHREDARFASVRERIPSDWAADWIDYIHTYVWPEVDETFMAIFREYAPDIEAAPAGALLRRVPI